MFISISLSIYIYIYILHKPLVLPSEFLYNFINILWVPHGVVVNMLDCNIIVRGFKLQSCYYIHFQTNTHHERHEPPYSSMLDCNIVGSELKLQSCYYIHFQTNTLGKGMNPLMPLC